MSVRLIRSLEMGIIDLVQFQFGRRPLLTARGVQALILSRFK